jgi:hypothetical protein
MPRFNRSIRNSSPKVPTLIAKGPLSKKDFHRQDKTYAVFRSKAKPDQAFIFMGLNMFYQFGKGFPNYMRSVVPFLQEPPAKFTGISSKIT